MKNYILINAQDEIMEKANLMQNLSRYGEVGLRLDQTEETSFIGDKFQNGVVIPIETPGGGREKIKVRREKKITLRTKLQNPPFNFDSEEVDILLGE